MMYPRPCWIVFYGNADPARAAFYIYGEKMEKGGKAE